jgi:membrane-bound serine protease (ClpP class)
MLAFFMRGIICSNGRVFNTVINIFTSCYWSFTDLSRYPFLYRLMLLGTLVTGIAGSAAAADSLVYTISVREEISPGMARKFGKAMQEATALGADKIILHINTYGGLLDAADSIRTAILNSPIPVIAFIDNNAASAGALISIACDRIYMRSGANIGAATVVDASAQPLPDKYQSYMRAMMRSTAEKRGRDPLIAEAMVDPRTYIPGVNDSGKVLSFTTREAILNGYCDGQAESLQAVYDLESVTTWQEAVFVPSFLDNLISILVNPMVSGILLLLMLGGIYYELQAPGIGFPLLVAGIAAVLYFAPLYIEGMAANWEILLAICGFVLLAVEIFVLPGFGIAGISGIVLLIVAFTFSMVGNDGFDFSGVPADSLLNSLGVVMISVTGGIVLSFFTGNRLLHSRRFERMVNTGTMTASSGYTSSDAEMGSMIGQYGVALTVLRPMGKVSIGGVSYPASSESGFTNQGTKIVVTRIDGNTMWVKETT